MGELRNQARAKRLEKEGDGLPLCRGVPPTAAALSNMDYSEPTLVVYVVATDHLHFGTNVFPIEWKSERFRLCLD